MPRTTEHDRAHQRGLKIAQLRLGLSPKALTETLIETSKSDRRARAESLATGLLELRTAAEKGTLD
ncbi:MAG: hypothetical protein NVS3B20_22290 [Polyangiales bacterium]